VAVIEARQCDGVMIKEEERAGRTRTKDRAAALGDRMKEAAK
jgi:hypothetical protein